MQGVLSFVCALYQISAILAYNGLLKYRMYISTINKLVIAYILYLLVITISVRFSQEGKLCSGDHLTWEQSYDPQFADTHMLKIGNIFKGYILGAIGIVITSIGSGLFVVWLMSKVFS